MEQTIGTPPAVTYDRLRRDPNFPRSRAMVIKEMLGNSWTRFKRSFPKNILIMLGFALFFWLLNMILMCFVNDTIWIYDNNRVLPGGSWVAYLLHGGAYPDVKGFSSPFSSGYKATWPYVTLFTLSLSLFLGGFLSRMRRGGLGAPFRDFVNIPRYAGACKAEAKKPLSVYVWRGLFLAFALGFFMKNPFAIILVSLWFLHSFGMGAENAPAEFFFLWKVTGNIKKDNPPNVSFADSALPFFGLGVGFLVYFMVVLVLWNLLDYGFWARVIFSFAPALLFFFFSFINPGRKAQKAVQVMACLLLVCGIINKFGLTAFADDGGWTESGKNIPGWWRNPGTELMNNWLLANFFIHWVGKMVFDNVVNFKTKTDVTGNILDLSQGKWKTNQDIAENAWDTVFTTMIPNMPNIPKIWGQASDALSGGGQGGSAGGSGGGSGGSSGGGSGSGSGGSSGGGGGGGGGKPKPSADEGGWLGEEGNQTPGDRP